MRGSLLTAVTGSGLAQALGILMALAAVFLPAAPASANAAPGAPVGLVVAPGNAKLVAGWNPPESNGGAAVTSYTVQYKHSNAADRPADFNDPANGWVTASDGVTDTDAEITGLTNSFTYDVRVRASNSDGDGQWSDAASATPNEDVVWAAILTVDVNKYNYFGCNRVFFSHDREFDECSVALTEDEFEFAGATYRWTQFLDKASPRAIGQSDHAGLSDSTPVPPDSPLRRGKMQFGDITLSLDNTDHVGWWPDRKWGDGFNVYHPSARATQNWVEGQKVPLNLQVTVSKVEAAAPPEAQVLSPTTLTLTVDKATVSEEEGAVTVTATLDNPAVGDGVEVTLTAGDGSTATANDDYTLPPAFTIAEGETTATATLTIVDDAETEVAETIELGADTGSSGLITVGATVTISPSDNDNNPPQLQGSDDGGLFDRCRNYTRGLEGLRACVLPDEGGEAVLMLTLPGPAPAGGTTVTLATDPRQTATSDDYTMPSTITIGEGETSGLITIAITEDDEDEGDESIYIYACIRSGCDPLNPIDGEKAYNHGIVIPGTRSGGL